MTAYLVRRVLWAAALFFVITFVTYILFFVVPTGVQRSGIGRATETIDVRRATGISGSLPSEYWQFLKGIAHGSLGRSSSSRREVRDVLVNAAPVTGSLVLGGALVWLALAVPIGFLSALRPRSLLDRAAMVFVLVGISAHPAWIGLVLSRVFGYSLHLTPIAGYCDLFHPPPGAICGGPAQWASHLLLPWLTFALLFAALYARMIRALVTEAVNDDYVRTARAKGASEWRVLRAHVARNALLPVVAMLGMDVSLAFGGVVFVERVYGLPGIGQAVLVAYARRDLPTIIGVTLLVTVAIIVFNTLADLLSVALDPRVRLGYGERTSPGSDSEPRLSRRSSASRRRPEPEANAPTLARNVSAGKRR